MNLLGSFGLDPVMLAAQIINFLIVFYILKKFLYKPILDILNKRRETIISGLKDSEEGKRLLEKAKVEEKNILTNANLQAQKIIESAKQETLEITKKMKLDAKKDIDVMILDAKEKISQETNEAEKKLIAKVSNLAVEFLSKSLSELIDPALQKELTLTALKKLGKN